MSVYLVLFQNYLNAHMLDSKIVGIQGMNMIHPTLLAR